MVHSLPIQYKRVLDPLETLTFAAAHTRRVALDTSVLNLPWYAPVLLARQLITLDVLSRGRLRVRFGIGWSPGVEAVDDIVARMEQLWEISKAP